MRFVLFGLLIIFSTVAIAAPYPAENTKATCQDGLDNDHDGHVDCADQDCQDFVFCAGHSKVASPVYAPYPLPPPYLPLSVSSDSERARRLTRAGKICLGVGLGTSAIAFGLVLASLDDNFWKPKRFKVEVDEVGLFAPGMFLALTGTALTITGIVLWVKGATKRPPSGISFDWTSQSLRF